MPTWDPSVLFTPAGMNQFKDHFLGKLNSISRGQQPVKNVCEPAISTMSDGPPITPHVLRDVGNFSFGDYFKNEAIHWAWEFLTDKKMARNRSRPTFGDRLQDDDEAAAIWNEKIGLPTSKISRLEEDENFWPASAQAKPGRRVRSVQRDLLPVDNGKTVEIWNLVFTQFNRVGNPPNNLRPLPCKNIDTGMGLERTASVLQGKPSNFHIDILFPIVQAASEVCGVAYEYDSDAGRRLRRITDHVRHVLLPSMKTSIQAQEGSVCDQAIAATRRARWPSTGNA